MVAWDKRRERETPINNCEENKNEKHKVGGGYRDEVSAATLGAYHEQGDDEAIDWPHQKAMVAWGKRREREAPI